MRSARLQSVAFATTFGAVVLLVHADAWAGGNTQVRNPAAPSEIITRRWDDRQLPLEWVLSDDGLPASGIDNATLTGEVAAAFDTWEAIAPSRLDFTFGGEVRIRETSRGGPLGAGIDGHNLVTFTDPDLVFPTGVLAVAITFAFTPSYSQTRWAKTIPRLARPC
jgi:hypothetical protein